MTHDGQQPRRLGRTRRSTSLTLAALAALALTATACAGGATSGTTGTTGSSGTTGSAGAAGARRTVVVTYSVLGAVARQVVGDAADVKVLMPNGADPHEWQPSAKDVQAIMSADLLLDNGLGLEGNLADTLSQARAKGVTEFSVADHVTVRTVGQGEGADPSDPDQAPGAKDPHLWLDPVTMKQWLPDLTTTLRAKGVDVSTGAAAVEKDLTELDGQLRTTLGAVPQDRRKLVTGHESLGYFAARYGFTLVGTVVPGVSSQGEPSAGELADLTRTIKQSHVPAIFVEVGTPKATAAAIARDTGARTVELSTHNLAADGSYRTFMLDLAKTVAGALQ